MCCSEIVLLSHSNGFLGKIIAALPKQVPDSVILCAQGNNFNLQSCSKVTAYLNDICATTTSSY